METQDGYNSFNGILACLPFPQFGKNQHQKSKMHIFVKNIFDDSSKRNPQIL